MSRDRSEVGPLLPLFAMFLADRRSVPANKKTHRQNRLAVGFFHVFSSIQSRISSRFSSEYSISAE